MNSNLPITIHATYEGGALKLDQPLAVPDGTKLQVTIAAPQDVSALDEADRQIVREIIVEDREIFDALGR